MNITVKEAMEMAEKYHWTLVRSQPSVVVPNATLLVFQTKEGEQHVEALND